MIDLRHLTYTDADGSSWVEVDLRYEDFFNIRFGDRVLEHETHEFMRYFADKPLRKIADRMIRHYWSVDTIDVFRKTQEDVQSDWFGTFVTLAEKFTKHQMDRQRIWISAELAEGDLNTAIDPIYIRGGHHRCLVYAVMVLTGDLAYKPVHALLQVPGRDWRLVE